MKKILFCCILTLTVVCGMLLGAVAVDSSASEQSAAVFSYGLSVLSANTDVAVMTLVGNDVTFSADTFARGLNLSKVKYVTVYTLPPAQDGELLLGSTRIAAGQSISAENLPYMVFSPVSDEAPMQSSFTFTANGGTTPIVCNMYLLDRGNQTPTVSVASGLSLNISTYKGHSHYGTLSAYDPDGDEMTFEVVSYPQNGSIRMTDKAMGSYIYTPQASYVGSDRFTYVARDRYGNYSSSATVHLEVDLSGTSVVYEDMKDWKEYNSALALTDAGIMSGTQVGNSYYFYPEKSVSRVEFLVMAMNAVGITDVPKCNTTVFADDAQIPDAMKGYVSAAYQLGYVSGSEVDGKLCFSPNESLTRAQAAVILERLVDPDGAAVSATFADTSEIPTWASGAITSLHAAGIMSAEDGYIAPSATLTRAQTAQMLASAMRYVNL